MANFVTDNPPPEPQPPQAAAPTPAAAAPTKRSIKPGEKISAPAPRQRRQKQGGDAPPHRTFRERMADRGTPLDTPQAVDAVQTVSVRTVDISTRKAIQILRGAFNPSSDRPVSLPVATLPRRGEHIAAGGFHFEVKLVVWSYSALGVPSVLLAVELIDKTS